MTEPTWSPKEIQNVAVKQIKKQTWCCSAYVAGQLHVRGLHAALMPPCAGAQAAADLVEHRVKVRLRAERAEDPGGIVAASHPGGSVSGTTWAQA